MIKWNLDFETISTCNRVCPTCMRNSNPNRELVADWFTPNYLPEHVIYAAIIEAMKIDSFSGVVCLNHYNEPFMDQRISQIAWTIKETWNLTELYMHSNGDLVTEGLAKDIDGSLDKIIFTLYMDDPIKTKRKEWLASLFKKTQTIFITESIHASPVHFSPKFLVAQLAQDRIDHTCLEPSMRVAINHKRQYLMCCDDMTGNFGLGTYPEISIKEHLEQKMKMQERLMQFGGRRDFAHCTTCPRP